MRHITLIFLSFVSLFSYAVDFSFNKETEFLHVDEAFSFSFSPTNSHEVELTWDIADGYYLYQHQIKVEESSAINAKLTLDPLPVGKEKVDPYFGDVIIYRQQLKTAFVYDNTLAAGTVVKATVHYQGCADKGLCYPPQTKVIQFTTPAPTTVNITQSQSTSFAIPAPSQANYVMDILQEGNIATAIFTLFMLGLFLSFTPCVLPMIPIVSAIVVGNSQRFSASSRAKWSNLYYSGLYVFTMAATYAVFGALAGYFGAQFNLQAYLQSPFVLASSAILFILLALAMFGVYELSLPASWQNGLSRFNNSNTNHKSFGVVIAAVLATLVVSPCVSAPLAGVLLFISSQGEVTYGALLLFVMALGMGVPLLLVGIFGDKALPKSGEWLNDIKVVMGFALLAIAIWLLSRWHITEYQLYFWATLCLFISAYFFTRYRLTPSNPIRLGLAICMLVLGVLQALGASSGGHNPLRPLAKLEGYAASNQKAATLNFTTLSSLTELEAVLSDTSNTQPILLDLYADWCISCKVIEEEIFLAEDVYPLLSQFTLIKADVTQNSVQNQQLMQHYNLYGPPSLLFFTPQGKLIKEMSIIGEPNKQEVLERLEYTAHLSTP